MRWEGPGVPIFQTILDNAGRRDTLAAMNLADDIQKLRDLHQSGALNDAEFEAAKSRLLGGSAPPPLPPAQSFSPPPPETYAQPPAHNYAPPQAPLTTPPAETDAATRQWAMLIHLTQLAGFVVPLAGLVVPIVLWQIKKQELPGIDAHGCHAANWIITELILGIVCIPLCFVLIGIPLLIVLGVLGIVFPIIAGVKANNGELWRYPMSFTFFRPQATVGTTSPDSTANRAEWPDQTR